jgi:hypothetical protein
MLNIFLLKNVPFMGPPLNKNKAKDRCDLPAGNYVKNTDTN